MFEHRILWLLLHKSLLETPMLRPRKKSVFRVTGLKILGKIGIHVHILSKIFISEKKKNVYNFMHFERQNAFQNA